MKILAVDDDRIILGLLERFLESADYGAVHTCESAEDALKLIDIEEKPFTCFLLDIQMPGMDGIELCRRIREFPQHADTPILMLTSMSEKSYIDRAFSAGASDYLTKPLDATEIVVRLGIAEQLANERNSLAESAGVIDSLIDVLDRATRHDLEVAIDLGRMDRLLRYPSFENYVYQSGRGALFRSTVFAAKVRDAEALHRLLPPLEFKNFLRTAASTIIDRLEGDDVFIAYRGEGEFVGVIPRKGQQVLNTLGEEIAVPIEDSDGKHPAKLPESATLVFAPAAPTRLPTRGEMGRAIWTAVENVRQKAAPVAPREPKRRIMRGTHNAFTSFRRNEEIEKADLRAEFTQLLREQLKSDVGEHPRPPRAREKKAPPSIFKKIQETGKRTRSRELGKVFRSKKSENLAQLRGDGARRVRSGDTEGLPASPNGAKEMRYSNV